MSRLLPLLFLFAWQAPVWAGDKLIPLTPAQRQALRVVSAPLTAHAGAVSVGLPAQVVIPPAQERVVAAPVAGLVSEVRVAAGDGVRAGQVLAVLRAEELMGAQRELAQAAVQARLAEEAVRRDTALFQEGIIPEARVQAARATLAQARALLEERRAWLRLVGLSGSALQAAEAGQRFTDTLVLTAPMAGVVLEQTAVTGTRVAAAQGLFKIARLHPLWLEIQAPAELAAQVRPGQKVSIPGTEASGRVLAVGRAVSAAQTVSIRAQVDNPGGVLRLNQNVAARLEGVAGARQWRVPVKALVRQAGRQWVFVERPGGFEPEAVQVLSQTAQQAAIDGPFSGDEKIAVEGVAALKAAWQGE
jgi:RND family efflux transporter MFP subunit